MTYQSIILIAQAITAVGAIALVVVTFLYVRATTAMVNEMRTAREEEARPYVIADLDLNDRPIINLVISNIGKGAARNVRCTFDPQLINSDGEVISDLPFLKEGIEFLAPGKQMSTFVNTITQMYNPVKSGDLPGTWDVTVSYDDIHSQKSYQHNFKLDLNAYFGQSYIDRKTVHDIGKSLEEIAKALSKATEINDGFKIITRTERLRRNREWEERIEKEKQKVKKKEQATEQSELNS